MDAPHSAVFALIGAAAIGAVWGFVGFIVGMTAAPIAGYLVAAVLPPLAVRGLFPSAAGRRLIAACVVAVIVAFGAMLWAAVGYGS